MLEEIFPTNPTERQLIDNLLHSTIEIDQLIVLDVGIVQDVIKVGEAEDQALTPFLSKILSYAQQHSDKVREARKLLRELQ
ncbi:MAG: hypothetical protein OK457_00825 [Thaumarchaeota archaeon]|nr:hypothetical protein [Nitrososphaerota archaeon]